MVPSSMPRSMPTEPLHRPRYKLLIPVHVLITLLCFGSLLPGSGTIAYHLSLSSFILFGASLPAICRPKCQSHAPAGVRESASLEVLRTFVGSPRRRYVLRGLCCSSSKSRASGTGITGFAASLLTRLAGRRRPARSHQLIVRTGTVPSTAAGSTIYIHPCSRLSNHHTRWRFCMHSSRLGGINGSASSFRVLYTQFTCNNIQHARGHSLLNTSSTLRCPSSYSKYMHTDT